MEFLYSGLEFLSSRLARSEIPNLSKKTPCVVNLEYAHPEFLASASKSTWQVKSTSPGRSKIFATLCDLTACK